MSDMFDDFNFKVRLGTSITYVAGISKVSALVRSTAIVEHGEESIPEKSPGRTVYEAITLERGRTSDTAFEDWANLVPGAPVTPTTLIGAEFRKDIIIDLFDEAGQRVMSFKVYRCWPSRYETLPALNANGHDVAVEQLTLEHEGWERDLSVVPPVNTA
jgi:phage tail-like protein